MKIGILFEGKPANPGGFNQSFNSALILNEIKEYKNDFTFITLNNQANENLSNHNIRAILYNNNILLKILSILYSVEFISSLLKKLGIKHPFTNFLKKNNFDIVIPRYKDQNHPVFGIWSLDLIDSLKKYLLDEDLKKIDTWIFRNKYKILNFKDLKYDPFFNINTVQELSKANSISSEFDI